MKSVDRRAPVVRLTVFSRSFAPELDLYMDELVAYGTGRRRDRDVQLGSPGISPQHHLGERLSELRQAVACNIASA